MHQFDNNRFNTFGNEMDLSTLASSQRARRALSMRKSPSEPHNRSEELHITGEEIFMRRHDSGIQGSSKNFDSKAGHSQKFRSKNQRQDSIESSDEAHVLLAIASKQLVGIERSLENTSKSQSEKEDLKNTLSLLFPCEYYVPESFGSTAAVDNKTILEVTESEKDCIKSLESNVLSKRAKDDYHKQVEKNTKKEDTHQSERNHGSVRDLPKASGREGIISDRLTFTEYQTDRTKVPDDSERRTSSTNSDKSYLINEFKSLKKEVFAIQKDLKVSEDYNKKLEEHIYNQNSQIMHMLQNFTSMKDGNPNMKNPFSGFTSRRTVQAKEEDKVQKPVLEKHEVIDYAVSKKANKFFSEEMSLMKTRYEKIIRNHENIIEDLQRQLKAKDAELEESRKLQEEKDILKASELIQSQLRRTGGSDLHRSEQESYLHHKESPALSHKRIGFSTPSKAHPLGEIKQSNSQERHGEFKANKIPKSMRDHETSHTFDNSKHSEVILRELQKSKGKDKENIPRDSYMSRPSEKRASASKSSSHLPLGYHHAEHSNLYTKEKSGMDSQIYPSGKELMHVASENILQMRPSNPLKENSNAKMPLQNQNQNQNQQKNLDTFVTEEDLKKSFADISFDVSYLKENIDKRLESEITSLNISPTKEQEWKYNKPSQAPKNNNNNKKPIHNISQFNEISIIKEQPSENFITDSIQTKIFSELQSYPDTDRKLAFEDQDGAYQNIHHEYRTDRPKTDYESKKQQKQGMKDYPKSSSEYSSRNKENCGLPKKQDYGKDNLDQYQVNNYPRKAEKKREDPYKRSESSGRLDKPRTHQGQRLSEDPSQENRIRKEEDAYEREYREYLKELAKNSNKQSRCSVSSSNQQVKYEKERKAQSRGKERTNYPEARRLDKYSSIQNINNNDTIVTLNKALEEILEKDQGKGVQMKHHRNQVPEPAKYDKLYEERDSELDQLQAQPRSRSSGHSRKRSGGNNSQPNLQLAAPSYSSKAVSSSRVDAPESSVRRNYEKNYEVSSSRKNLNVLNEDSHHMENYNTGIDQGYNANKQRLETSKSGLNKYTTPTNNSHSSHHKLPLSNMKYSSESAAQSQASFGREVKSNSKSHYNNVNADSMYRNTNSFENTSGRSSAFRHNEKQLGSGNSKDYKYAYNSTKYQIGPFNDISIVDYKYPEDGKGKDIKRTQPSTNDFVNFDSVLQDKEGHAGGYKDDNSFALFQEKYSNANFDSVNSSTLFDAFPIRKSQLQRDSAHHNQGQVLKLNKYF